MDLVLHAVFTFNSAVFVAASLWYFSRRCLHGVAERQMFLLAAAAVLVVRIAYVVFFVYLLPERILSTDGARYLFEIRQIAETPWEWNPITGAGPYYQVTPKMGMSYLYGVVLFIHQVDSLYAVLALNVVFGLFTAVAVYLLTRRLTHSFVPAALAMILTAVYPETLFWTSRVARENVTLFLVPALVYAGLRLFETYRLRYLVYATAAIGALLLVRAQLVLFAGLMVVFFGVRALGARHRGRAVMVAAFTAILLYGAMAALQSQIRRAAGSEILQLLSLDRAWWAAQSEGLLRSLGAVLSPVARGDYGAAGLLMVPFALALSGLLVLTLVRFRSIFAENRQAAALLLFLSVTFLFGLAVIGAVNIRFRSTVAPLLLSLVSVSVHYYWKRWRLPRLRL